jgi:hypothetical protein
MNRAKSRELAAKIVVNVHDCFQNALRGLAVCREAFFVVGLAGEEEPLVHAWLQVEGDIIDPSNADLPADSWF